MIHYSVIVPAYNAEKAIVEYLGAPTHQSPGADAFEIIVVSRTAT
jgi:glycosyltransferase involved in cell wall biosynthesis